MNRFEYTATQAIKASNGSKSRQGYYSMDDARRDGKMDDAIKKVLDGDNRAHFTFKGNKYVIFADHQAHKMQKANR